MFLRRFIFPRKCFFSVVHPWDLLNLLSPSANYMQAVRRMLIRLKLGVVPALRKLSQQQQRVQKSFQPPKLSLYIISKDFGWPQAKGDGAAGRPSTFLSSWGFLGSSDRVMTLDDCKEEASFGGQQTTWSAKRRKTNLYQILWLFLNKYLVRSRTNAKWKREGPSWVQRTELCGSWPVFLKWTLLPFLPQLQSSWLERELSLANIEHVSTDLYSAANRFT